MTEVKKRSQESQFIHDLSTPMTTLAFHLDSLLHSLEDQLTESDLNRLLESQQLIKRLHQLIQERRTHLHSNEKPESLV